MIWFLLIINLTFANTVLCPISYNNSNQIAEELENDLKKIEQKSFLKQFPCNSRILFDLKNGDETAITLFGRFTNYNYLKEKALDSIFLDVLYNPKLLRKATGKNSLQIDVYDINKEGKVSIDSKKLPLRTLPQGKFKTISRVKQWGIPITGSSECEFTKKNKLFKTKKDNNHIYYTVLECTVIKDESHANIAIKKVPPFNYATTKTTCYYRYEQTPQYFPYCYFTTKGQTLKNRLFSAGEVAYKGAEGLIESTFQTLYYANTHKPGEVNNDYDVSTFTETSFWKDKIKKTIELIDKKEEGKQLLESESALHFRVEQKKEEDCN